MTIKFQDEHERELWCDVLLHCLKTNDGNGLMIADGAVIALRDRREKKPAPVCPGCRKELEDGAAGYTLLSPMLGLITVCESCGRDARQRLKPEPSPSDPVN